MRFMWLKLSIHYSPTLNITVTYLGQDKLTHAVKQQMIGISSNQAEITRTRSQVPVKINFRIDRYL